MRIKYVFATADKMNAMAATAEGLDTIYISRAGDLNKITLGVGYQKTRYSRILQIDSPFCHLLW